MLDLFSTVDRYSDESDSDDQSDQSPVEMMAPSSPPCPDENCCCDKYGNFLPLSTDDDSGFEDVEHDDMFHKWTSDQARKLSSSRPDFAAELNNLFGSTSPQDSFEQEHMNMV